MPTSGPLLILPPALKWRGSPRWRGLCSHLAHKWATFDSAPRSKAEGLPEAAGVKPAVPPALPTVLPALLSGPNQGSSSSGNSNSSSSTTNASSSTSAPSSSSAPSSTSDYVPSESMSDGPAAYRVTRSQAARPKKCARPKNTSKRARDEWEDDSDA